MTKQHIKFTLAIQESIISKPSLGKYYLEMAYDNGFSDRLFNSDDREFLSQLRDLVQEYLKLALFSGLAVDVAVEGCMCHAGPDDSALAHIRSKIKEVMRKNLGRRAVA